MRKSRQTILNGVAGDCGVGGVVCAPRGSSEPIGFPLDVSRGTFGFKASPAIVLPTGGAVRRSSPMRTSVRAMTGSARHAMRAGLGASRTSSLSASTSHARESHDRPCIGQLLGRNIKRSRHTMARGVLCTEPCAISPRRSYGWNCALAWIGKMCFGIDKLLL